MSDIDLQELKKEKIHLKDELIAMVQSTGGHTIADAGRVERKSCRRNLLGWVRFHAKRSIAAGANEHALPVLARRGRRDVPRHSRQR